MAYGTLSVLDTLASSQQTIAAFGEDNAFSAIAAMLAAHNAQVAEMTADLMETTTDRQRRYGGDDSMAMDEVDEYGTADAQKITAGVTVGFPLRLYSISLQWTRKYFENALGAEVAAQAIAARDADMKALQREMKRAIFKPTNATFVDRLVDNVSLAVKAFVNNDGAAVPVGPNGETFAGTHNHYLGTASFVAANLTSLIETVVEHHNVGQVKVYINRAQEAAIRAFTGFTAYLDARIIPGSATTSATSTLDNSNLYNRSIGLFGGAEIWVKPWMPAGYVFAFVDGGPRPLVYRQRRPGAGFELDYEDEAHPLRAKGWSREFGIGVWRRTAGAVLDTVNASYTAPTIT